jgi:hypothetical protein
LTGATGVSVATSANGSVWIPFTSPENAAAAQLGMAQVNTVVDSGFLQQVNWAGGSGTLPAPQSPAFLGGAVVTVAASSNLGLMPASYYSLANASTAIVAAIGGANTTVVSGNESTLLYQNISSAGEIYLGGGLNYITEAFDTSAALITVDGGPNHLLGSGGAIIDASRGSSTIQLFPNAIVNVIGGGTVQVQGMPGTEVVGVSGSSTVPVSIAGGGGVDLIYTPDGGDAQINPGAGNLIVVAGSGGAETVWGGAATIGGAAVTAPSFTGASTVFAGIGYFVGGTAGGNSLQTSTLPGVATLVGAGAGDVLQANAAGDLLIAGSGSETLFGSTLVTGGGDTFITGDGATTVIGGPGGNNTIEFGGGTSDVYGQHNIGGAGSITGNRYLTDTPGGSQTIGDFLPGYDVFDVADSAGHPSVQSLSYYASAGASPFGQVGSQLMLSDGTLVNFLNAQVSQHGGSIT